MKTAISIPDSIFEEAEALASDLGMSRSELFAKAIASFIESQKYKSVTAQLNAVYATENAALDKDIAKMQYESIGHKDWDNNEAW
jgi:metal-responsive CopG/Arc/MetJ family transcriptional regulator